MSRRFTCGLLVLAAFFVSLFSLVTLQILWLAMGAFAVALASSAIFFFMSLE